MNKILKQKEKRDQLEVIRDQFIDSINSLSDNIEALESWINTYFCKQKSLPLSNKLKLEL